MYVCIYIYTQRERERYIYTQYINTPYNIQALGCM